MVTIGTSRPATEAASVRKPLQITIVSPLVGQEERRGGVDVMAIDLEGSSGGLGRTVVG